jgi:DNA-binding transcriptional regulator YdaS (Cro superfamily)
MASRGQSVNPSDRDLVAKAKLAVGGATKLAKTLEMSKQAISEWGRTRPIPRHARARLEDIVRGRIIVNEAKTNDTPWQVLGSVVIGTGLHVAPPLAMRRANRVRLAWQRADEDQKNDLRNYVRQAAFIATAIKELLSNDVAQKLIAALSAEVSTHVNKKLLDQA